MHYINKYTEPSSGNITTQRLVMCSKSHAEGVTFYIGRTTVDAEGAIVNDEAYPNASIPIDLDRKMAYRLIKELEARLFGGRSEDMRLSQSIEPNFDLWD